MDLVGLLLVLLVVNPGETDAEWTKSFARTAQESLGIEVQVVEGDGTDAPLDASSNTVQIGVRWSADRTTAVVEVARDGTHSSREIHFEADDPWGQRGRTLAFVAVSMMPDAPRASPHEPDAPPPVTTPEVQRPPIVVPQVERIPTLSVEAVGQAWVGLGDDSVSAWGGEGAVLWHVHRRIALRLGVGGRGATIPQAQSTMFSLESKVGVAWTFASIGGSRGVDLEARLDVGALHHAVTHLSADDPTPSSRGAWVFGCDALFQLAYHPSESLWLVGATGIGVASTELVVFVGDNEAARVSNLAWLTTLGVRASF